MEGSTNLKCHILITSLKPLPIDSRPGLRLMEAVGVVGEGREIFAAVINVSR